MPRGDALKKILLGAGNFYYTRNPVRVKVARGNASNVRDLQRIYLRGGAPPGRQCWEGTSVFASARAFLQGRNLLARRARSENQLGDGFRRGRSGLEPVA